MKIVAVIGPVKAVLNFMDDFHGVVRNRTQISITVGDVVFRYAGEPYAVQGVHLAGFVTVGHRDDWTDDLRATLEAARTRLHRS